MSEFVTLTNFKLLNIPNSKDLCNQIYTNIRKPKRDNIIIEINSITDAILHLNNGLFKNAEIEIKKDCFEQKEFILFIEKLNDMGYKFEISEAQCDNFWYDIYIISI